MIDHYDVNDNKPVNEYLDWINKHKVFTVVLLILIILGLRRLRKI